MVSFDCGYAVLSLDFYTALACSWLVGGESVAYPCMNFFLMQEYASASNKTCKRIACYTPATRQRV